MDKFLKVLAAIGMLAAYAIWWRTLFSWAITLIDRIVDWRERRWWDRNKREANGDLEEEERDR